VNSDVFNVKHESQARKTSEIPTAAPCPSSGRQSAVCIGRRSASLLASAIIQSRLFPASGLSEVIHRSASSCVFSLLGPRPYPLYACPHNHRFGNLLDDVRSQDPLSRPSFLFMTPLLRVTK